MKRVGIVVGESSGDRLGAGLITELKARYPGLQVEGIVGPRLVEIGADVIYPAERLAVMGLGEIARRYWELRAMRNDLLQRFVANPPDVFVGVDAPEFNLGLAHKLRNAGVKTVQYVSPQVWAWREWRVRHIASAVDLILTLFPFEADYYRQHNVPVQCVGHPLADEMAVELDAQAACGALALSPEREWVALCPGSRANEWYYHMEPFIDTAIWLSNRRDKLGFLVAAVNEDARDLFVRQVAERAPSLDFQVFVGRTRQVLAAASVVLTVSGTATLETMLAKRPMVVAYRLGALSYWIARALVRVPFIAMPNLLAGRQLVPEFIQGDVRPERMGPAILDWLNDPVSKTTLREQYQLIHAGLRLGGHSAAAAAIDSLWRAQK